MRSDDFSKYKLIINNFLKNNRNILLSLKKKKGKTACDNGRLNYARLYLPYGAKKVSVVGYYVTNDTDFRTQKKYARLDYNENTDEFGFSLHTGDEWDDFYYGVSPIIDAKLIVEEIRKKTFQGKNGIRKFVCKYANHFMIHEQYADSIDVIAQYITAGMLQKFGLKFLCTPLIEEIAEKLSDKNLKFVEEKNKKETKRYLYVCGCPSESFFKAFEELRFKAKGQVLFLSDTGDSLETLFNKPGIIHNLSGQVYYSGVLLRTLHIDQEEDAVNQGVISIRIHFERTTYAAVDALSNNFTNSCFLSSEVKQVITDILRSDDGLKQMLLTENPEESNEDFLNNINEYLKQTVSTVQVGVSANVVSSDGFLLFGQREKGTIDENSIYPGVNGNAEIADKNVTFYKTSTKEDYPDIDINNLFRIDFNGEISREMLAELNVESFHKNWDCYGFCLTGTTPSFFKKGQNGPYREAERRLHFNILFEQEIEQNLYQIKKKQKNATEKYENRYITGIRYSFFDNGFSLIVKKTADFLKNILNFKDFITTALAVIVFFVALKAKEQALSSWISMIFSALVFLQSILTVFDDFGKKKDLLLSKKRNILKKRVYMEKILTKEFSGKEMHPVVPLLLLCYIKAHTDD